MASHILLTRRNSFWNLSKLLGSQIVHVLLHLSLLRAAAANAGGALRKGFFDAPKARRPPAGRPTKPDGPQCS
eukprot:scaffold255727_cov19-Prasinocladus_malaysianus.AAC.1